MLRLNEPGIFLFFSRISYHGLAYMSTIATIIMYNFITFSMLVGLLIVMIFGRIIDKKSSDGFALCALIIFLIDINDIFERYYAVLPRLDDMRYLIKAVGYTLRPAVIAIIMNVTFRYCGRKRFIFWLPAVINGILAFTSYFTHWMFYFDINNNLIRGPIGYLTHITAMMYVAIFMYLMIRTKKNIDGYEIALLLYMGIICLTAMMLEVKFKLRFLVPGAMMVSCFLYYMFFYVQANKKDMLTRLLNRDKFYNDTDKLKGQQFALISMDMNNLKDINDNRGHKAGDRALADFSEVLLSCTDNWTGAYRVGGDEFMVVGKNMDEEGTKRFIDQARSELERTPYMCSFGYAIVPAHGDFDGVCIAADRMMYEDKKRYKHR